MKGEGVRFEKKDDGGEYTKLYKKLGKDNHNKDVRI